MPTQPNPTRRAGFVSRLPPAPPDWGAVLAALDAYGKATTAYARIQADNSRSARVPQAFQDALRELEALNAAMTRLEPTWKQGLNPGGRPPSDSPLDTLRQWLVDTNHRIEWPEQRHQASVPRLLRNPDQPDGVEHSGWRIIDALGELRNNYQIAQSGSDPHSITRSVVRTLVSLNRFLHRAEEFRDQCSRIHDEVTSLRGSAPAPEAQSSSPLVTKSIDRQIARLGRRWNSDTNIPQPAPVSGETPPRELPCDPAQLLGEPFSTCIESCQAGLLDLLKGQTAYEQHARQYLASASSPHVASSRSLYQSVAEHSGRVLGGLEGFLKDAEALARAGDQVLGQVNALTHILKGEGLTVETREAPGQTATTPSGLSPRPGDSPLRLLRPKVRRASRSSDLMSPLARIPEHLEAPFSLEVAQAQAQAHMALTEYQDFRKQLSAHRSGAVRSFPPSRLEAAEHAVRAVGSLNDLLHRAEDLRAQQEKFGGNHSPQVSAVPFVEEQYDEGVAALRARFGTLTKTDLPAQSDGLPRLRDESAALAQLMQLGTHWSILLHAYEQYATPQPDTAAQTLPGKPTSPPTPQTIILAAAASRRVAEALDRYLDCAGGLAAVRDRMVQQGLASQAELEAAMSGSQLANFTTATASESAVTPLQRRTASQDGGSSTPAPGAPMSESLSSAAATLARQATVAFRLDVAETALALTAAAPAPAAANVETPQKRGKSANRILAALQKGSEHVSNVVVQPAWSLLKSARHPGVGFRRR